MRRRCLAAALLLLAVGCTPAVTATLVGTDLGSSPAPDFTLTDGISGRAIRLTEQQGKVIALTLER